MFWVLIESVLIHFDALNTPICRFFLLLDSWPDQGHNMQLTCGAVCKSKMPCCSALFDSWDTYANCLLLVVRDCMSELRTFTVDLLPGFEIIRWNWFPSYFSSAAFTVRVVLGVLWVDMLFHGWSLMYFLLDIAIFGTRKYLYHSPPKSVLWKAVTIWHNADSSAVSISFTKHRVITIGLIESKW